MAERQDLIKEQPKDNTIKAISGEHNKADDKSESDTPISNLPIDTDKPLSEMSAEDFAEISEVDLAYKILNEAGKDNPIHFKTLILDVISKKNKVVQNAAVISEIYTMINMDSRFQYVKDGLWGLSDWYPPEVKRTRGKTADKTAEKKSSTSSRLKATLEEEPDEFREDTEKKF